VNVGGLKNTVGKIMDGKLMKGVGIGTMATIGMNAWQLGDTYNMSRQEGNGKLGSAAKAVGETLMMDAMGLPLYLGTQAVMAAPKAAVKAATGISQMSRSMSKQSVNKPFMNATFFDNQQAYTMRQAGMQMARASKYNLQQSLMGNEAQYMHL
jgi:hypothetical protein